MNFTTTIEEWYAEHGRELPWRHTRDPYRIWISEIILQQTRVAQGYAYYQRFIERFPTVEALALAEADSVMQAWEGLGYYSRARNLHAAARQIVALGHFPRDYEGIRALKGVGDYTAAAIASFAYGLPHAVVDGNVYRVLSRFFGIDTPIDTTAGKKEFSALAATLLDHKRPALYNQAIMDFGALQCVPRSPACDVCPLADTCVARAEGRVEQLPVKAKKTAIKERFFAYVIILDEIRPKESSSKEPSPEASISKGSSNEPSSEKPFSEAPSPEEPRVSIHRRGEGDIWTGLYEPLLIETPTRATLAEVVPEGYRVLRTAEGLKHQLTHRTIHADAYLIEKEDNASGIVLGEDFIKVKVSELQEYAAPRLVGIIYERLFHT